MLARDQTAIVGIGWTAFSRNSGASTMSLAAEASLKAIADAGLTPRDIDGVMSWYHKHSRRRQPRGAGCCPGRWTVPSSYTSTPAATGCAGRSSPPPRSSVSGVCKNVLLYVARNRYSEGRARRAAESKPRRGPTSSAIPFGEQLAATTFAHAGHGAHGALRHDDAGLRAPGRHPAPARDAEQEGEMRKPMTIEDHQSSRWISIRIACWIAASRPTARWPSSSPRRSARATCASGRCTSWRASAGESETQRALGDERRQSRAEAVRGGGHHAADVSFAELYDPFTGMCMLHMEDFGLVPKGEVGAWVTRGQERARRRDAGRTRTAACSARGT